MPVAPDLPPELERFLAATFATPELRRRALVAPWPERDFARVIDETDVWRTAGDPRRGAWETLVVGERAQLEAEPFFVAPGTGGTMRSAFPDVLPDDIYWAFTVAVGGDEVARHALADWPLPTFGLRTTVDVLRRAARPRWWRRRPTEPPRALWRALWEAQRDHVISPYL